MFRNPSHATFRRADTGNLAPETPFPHTAIGCSKYPVPTTGSSLAKTCITMCDNEDPDQSTVDSAAVEATVDGDKAADVELGLDNDLGNSLNEMANSLCSTCRKFPRGQIEARDFRVYHPSLTSLRESVQTGCWICKELTQSLDELCDRRQLRETLNEACFIQCRLIEFAHPRRSVGDGFYLEFLLCDSGVNCAVPKFDKPTLNDIIPFFAADYGVGEEVLGISTGQ